MKLPLIYEDQKIDVGYRIDTLINKAVIVVEQGSGSSITSSRSTTLDLYEAHWMQDRFSSQLARAFDETWHKAICSQPPW